MEFSNISNFQERRGTVRRLIVTAPPLVVLAISGSAAAAAFAPSGPPPGGLCPWTTGPSKRRPTPKVAPTVTPTDTFPKSTGNCRCSSPSSLLSVKEHSSSTKSTAVCGNRTGVTKLVQLPAARKFLMVTGELALLLPLTFLPFKWLLRWFTLH